MPGFKRASRPRGLTSCRRHCKSAKHARVAGRRPEDWILLRSPTGERAWVYLLTGGKVSSPIVALWQRSTCHRKTERRNQTHESCSKLVEASLCRHLDKALQRAVGPHQMGAGSAANTRLALECFFWGGGGRLHAARTQPRCVRLSLQTLLVHGTERECERKSLEHWKLTHLFCHPDIVEAYDEFCPEAVVALIGIAGLVKVKALNFLRCFRLVLKPIRPFEGTTKNFAWFYQSDCAQMEARLARIDKRRAGRVFLSLSNFYGASDFFGEIGTLSRCTGCARLLCCLSYRSDVALQMSTSRWRGRRRHAPFS